MKTTIVHIYTGLYRGNGKEHGNYDSICIYVYLFLGLYRD